MTHLEKLSFKNEGEIKISSGKQKSITSTRTVRKIYLRAK